MASSVETAAVDVEPHMLLHDFDRFISASAAAASALNEPPEPPRLKPSSLQILGLDFMCDSSGTAAFSTGAYSSSPAPSSCLASAATRTRLVSAEASRDARGAGTWTRTAPRIGR